MTRYFKTLTALLAVIAVGMIAPLSASAGCPGCDEYVLDVGGDKPPPAPAPAPAPTAPVAPAATAPVQSETTATAPVPVPVETEKKKKPEPVDTDPDPVPENSVEPPSLQSVPAVAAAQASAAGASDTAGASILPLAIALGAVAFVAAALGARGRSAEPAGSGDSPTDGR